MVYLISYDLTRPGQEYEELWDGLESLGAQRLLRSQWAVKWFGSAAELNAHLRGLIDAKDRLLVNALGEHAWTNLAVDPQSVA